MEHHHVVGPDSSQHDMDVPDLDTGFEPQFRARSNTWPLRPREIGKSEEDSRSTPTGSEAGDPAPVDATVGKEGSGLGLKTKSSSRRNAWGNLSYADLITKAIESSPEKRLTLSQIYDWMVQNVPYFKDKGDTNSSAGWKNSIRHNLSLHSRFMRIQNEGTGKSSWWVLNPDAKPGKSPRRRATSMDTKTYEKKRSRVKKKLDQLRALGVDHSPKGSELGDNDLSHSGELFSLSPQDFRGRTNSNASSLGGRLSPIQSMYEPDLQDGQVPPMSPVPWNQTTSYSHSDGFTETLSESLAEMIVGDTLSPGSSVELGASSLSTPSPLQQQTSPSGFLPAPPPPYPDGRHASPQQLSPNPNNIMDTGSACIDAGINGGHTLAPVNNIGGTGGAGINNRDIFLDDQYMAQELANLLQDSPPQSEQNQYAKPYQTADTNTTLMTASTDNSMLRQALTEKQQLVRSRLQAVLQNQHHRQRLQDRLKQLQHQQLQRQMQQRLQLQLQQQQQQHQQQQQLLQQQQAPQYQSLAQSGMSQTSSGSLQQHLLAGGVVQQTTQRSPVPAAGDNGLDYMLPLDLDLVTIAENNSEDLDCDVDEIISHELSLDGLLDFNFEANTASTNTSASGGTLQT